MQNEQLMEGGKLVTLCTGALGAEGVPAAKRGLIIHSAYAYANGERYVRGMYRLTRRVIAGTDLWHVVRCGSVGA